MSREHLNASNVRPHTWKRNTRYPLRWKRTRCLEVGHSDMRGSVRLPISVGGENDLPERPIASS